MSGSSAASTKRPAVSRHPGADGLLRSGGMPSAIQTLRASSRLSGSRAYAGMADALANQQAAFASAGEAAGAPPFQQAAFASEMRNRDIIQPLAESEWHDLSK